MMSALNKHSLPVLLLYTLLVFPLFYFVYKFGVLLAGYEDAKSYFILFGDISSPQVPAPFNMRLLSPLLINLLHRAGLFYNTECAIDAFASVDKRYFFTNVLFNFICVSLTSYSIFVSFRKLGIPGFQSFVGGMLFLLGFGTIFYLVMPGVDSLSVLLFTWLLYFYLRRSYLAVPFFLLLIFQREYYFLVFMLLAFMDYFREGRKRYFAVIFLIATACWVTYFLLRKYVFFTHHWHYQTSGTSLLGALLNIELDLVTMFRQTFMTMNLYFIYLGILLYKKLKGQSINGYYLAVTLLMFVQITILSIATTSGNNNGRYFYYTTPLFIYLIVLESASLMRLKTLESEIAGPPAPTTSS